MNIGTFFSNLSNILPAPLSAAACMFFIPFFNVDNIVEWFIMHMCLVRQSNPYILEQRWEWTFLKVHNLLNKKTASKFFFTYVLARTLRPKEAA